MESSEKPDINEKPEGEIQPESSAQPESSEQTESIDQPLVSDVLGESLPDSSFAVGELVRVSLTGYLRQAAEDEPGVWLVDLGSGTLLPVHESNILPSVEKSDTMREMTSTKSFKERAVDAKNKVSAVASQAAQGVAGRASQAKQTMSAKASYAGEKLGAVAEKASSAGEWVGSKAVAIKNRIVDKSAVVQTETLRRRLTIGNFGALSGNVIEKCVVAASAEDIGDLQYLKDRSIPDLLETDEFTSMDSENHSELTASGKRQMRQNGEDLSLQPGLGIAYLKGLKPEGLNQDAWCLHQVRGQFSLFAVFDGHGLSGHDVSDFVKATLPKLIIQDPRFKTERSNMQPIFKDAFEKMQRFIEVGHSVDDFDASLCGTTATIVFHDHGENKITVAHIGDSTACLVSLGGSPTGRGFRVMPLTHDHKPELAKEKEYIESKDGAVRFDGCGNHRVYAKASLDSQAKYPALNVSRSFGDLLGHRDAGIRCEPEISEHELDSDQMLLLCSDGVWTFVNFDEAAAIVADFSAEEYHQAADKLAKEAWDRWITEEGGNVVDDITVMLVNFGGMKLPAPKVAPSEQADPSIVAEGPDAVETTA